MIWLINIVAADAMKSILRPSLSTLNAAATAKIGFQICRQAEMRVWSVTLVMPTVPKTSAK